MDIERYVEENATFLGGIDNIIRIDAKDNAIYIRLKDTSIISLSSLCCDSIDASVDRGCLVIRFVKEEKEIKMDKYERIASEVLKSIGGERNITYATHCVTRLRINLKDDSIPDLDAIKAIDGVLGCQFSAGQFQVIIGRGVEKVYDAFCKMANIDKVASIEENLDKNIESKKKGIKDIVNGCLDGLTGCLVALIPVVIASGLVKMLYTLLGPNLLNVISTDSNLYQLLYFVGDAGYYFLPVFCGYTASKKFKTNTLISLLIGAILIHPTLIEIVNSKVAFDVYGIPMVLVNYSSSVIPMVLIVWVQSYVEKGLNKVIPEIIRRAFVPMLTVLIMLPLGLCALGPLGTLIGQFVSFVIISINNIFGPLSIAIVAALWAVLVTTGMHTTLRTFCITQLMTVGFDNIMLPAVMCNAFSVLAVGLAYALRSKSAEERSLGLTCALSQTFGGASEPTIFGILMPHKKIWACLMGGAFVGGFYMGIMGVACYIMSPSIYLAPMSFGGPVNNIINGLIGCAICFIATFILVYFIGAKKKEG